MANRPMLVMFALFASAACASPASVAPTAEPPLAEPPSAATATPTAHGKGMGPAEKPQAYQPGARELAAYERVEAVLAQHCHACHADGTRLSNGAAMSWVDMNAYPFGGVSRAQMGATIRASVGLEGAAATMPPDRVGLSADDLELIRAWAATLDVGSG